MTSDSDDKKRPPTLSKEEHDKRRQYDVTGRPRMMKSIWPSKPGEATHGLTDD